MGTNGNKRCKGYESFLNAYNGYASFYQLYFPRIVKIDLTSNTLGAIKVLENEKYFLKRDILSTFDKIENSHTYIGLDEDFKQLWISKITMK